MLRGRAAAEGGLTGEGGGGGKAACLRMQVSRRGDRAAAPSRNGRFRDSALFHKASAHSTCARARASACNSLKWPSAGRPDGRSVGRCRRITTSRRGTAGQNLSGGPITVSAPNLSAPRVETVSRGDRASGGVCVPFAGSAPSSPSPPQPPLSRSPVLSVVPPLRGVFFCGTVGARPGQARADSRAHSR